LANELERWTSSIEKRGIPLELSRPGSAHDGSSLDKIDEVASPSATKTFKSKFVPTAPPFIPSATSFKPASSSLKTSDRDLRSSTAGAAYASDSDFVTDGLQNWLVEDEAYRDDGASTDSALRLDGSTPTSSAVERGISSSSITYKLKVPPGAVSLFFSLRGGSKNGTEIPGLPCYRQCMLKERKLGSSLGRLLPVITSNSRRLLYKLA
jgi:hypothetical protein